MRYSDLTILELFPGNLNSAPEAQRKWCDKSIESGVSQAKDFPA